jgi:CBS domain-containing protein
VRLAFVEAAMRVHDGMNPDVLTIGPTHTLRDASRLMAQRHVGAAVVADAEGLGILTERDVLEAIGADQNPDVELVGNHLTKDLVFAAPDWNMDQAAAAMVRGGFRHLVVLDGNDVVGILAMRDIVRTWVTAAASTTAAT